MSRSSGLQVLRCALWRYPGVDCGGIQVCTVRVSGVGDVRVSRWRQVQVCKCAVINADVQIRGVYFLGSADKVVRCRW